MKFEEFSRRDFEFQLFKIVNTAVPKMTRLKAPTKLHYERMRKLAEVTERVLRGDFPALMELSSATRQPVTVRTRLAKSHRLLVLVYFHARTLTFSVLRDVSAESRKRPVDDATPYMQLKGFGNHYVKEANAKNILKDSERLEKLRMLNTGRLERYQVVAVQNGAAMLRPLWSAGYDGVVFFKIVAKEGQLFSVDVDNWKVWKYEPGVKGYECDKYVLVSDRKLEWEEIPPFFKKRLLSELV